VRGRNTDPYAAARIVVPVLNQVDVTRTLASTKNRPIRNVTINQRRSPTVAALGGEHSSLNR